MRSHQGSGKFKTTVLITFTFLIAILLAILPLPIWADWFRPAWVALTIIYWAFALPFRFKLGAAWIIGLFMDLIQGTLLGEHALIFTVIAYLVIKFQKRMATFSILQRTLIVFSLILLNQLFFFLIQGLTGPLAITWRYWITPFITGLFWPWVYNILKSCQRRFRIVDTSPQNFMFNRE